MAFLTLRWWFPVFQGMVLGLVAMLFHEAAHIVVALTLGIKVKKVGLGWKGIFTVREAGTARKNLIISLAGPVMNLALIFWWHWKPDFGLANLCCGVINLLPIAGSDGMRVRNCWRQLREKNPQG
jgi:Zn-dependent protease